MIKTILILAAVAVVCWLLYDQGYLIMQSKSAVSFVGEVFHERMIRNHRCQMSVGASG